MTTTQTAKNTQPRKTTEAMLNPEDWEPIAAWLKKHNASRSALGMFVRPEATAGLTQLLRKAARAEQGREITIRLRNDQMDALWEQMRFWTNFQDELRREFQRDMPNWRYFHCLADQIGGALEDTRRENDRRTVEGHGLEARPQGRTRARGTPGTGRRGKSQGEG